MPYALQPTLLSQTVHITSSIFPIISPFHLFRFPFTLSWTFHLALFIILCHCWCRFVCRLVHFLLYISTSCTFPFTLFIFSPHHLIHSVTSSVFFICWPHSSFCLIHLTCTIWHIFHRTEQSVFSLLNHLTFSFLKTSFVFICWVICCFQCGVRDSRV